MKHKIFDIIQIGDKSNKISRAFDVFIVVCIISNILVMILQTFDSLERFYSVFNIIETVTLGVFIIEYILRIWTANYLYENLSTAKARLKFIKSFDGIVDLLTIIPAFFLTGFVALRMLRVVRIMKLFRLNARYDSFNVITSVLYDKRNQIISSVFIILVLMTASSLCMYSAEHTVQPDVFKNAFSGFWWAVNAVLTVGYGDIYPVTTLGKLMAITISFLGVGVVAIPTGIISAGFVEQYSRSQNEIDYNIEKLHEISELLVDDRLCAKTVEELEDDCNFSILLIMRDDVSILPRGNIVLHLNDRLVIKINK
jgi:voltage-gated potassium channel